MYPTHGPDGPKPQRNDVAARDPTQFTEPLHHEFGKR